MERSLQQNEVLRCYVDPVLQSSTQRRTFLDLSCGSRADVRTVVEEAGHTWIGIDLIAHEGVVRGDAHYLPFRSGSFDVVYSAASFEHYRNPLQVAEEVARVLKPGGFFCGLIAFLQPWHGNSYYHFSHLGVKEMIEHVGLRVIDIRAGEMHGVTYLIREMFPAPIKFVGTTLSVYGQLLSNLRRVFFPRFIKLLYARDPIARDHKLAFLQEDKLRFAASIIFLSKKA